jgi:hypothetical protein
VSADAFPDLGIISSSAKANGFNAIFLTDHNLGSNFPISSMTANHMFFEDTYRRWTTATTGSLSSSTNQLVTSPVASGTSSLHLASTSSTDGETFVWTKRGPNFRTGTSDAIHPGVAGGVTNAEAISYECGGSRPARGPAAEHDQRLGRHPAQERSGRRHLGWRQPHRPLDRPGVRSRSQLSRAPTSKGVPRVGVDT